MGERQLRKCGAGRLCPWGSFIRAHWNRVDRPIAVNVNVTRCRWVSLLALMILVFGAEFVGAGGVTAGGVAVTPGMVYGDQAGFVASSRILVGVPCPPALTVHTVPSGLSKAIWVMSGDQSGSPALGDVDVS